MSDLSRFIRRRLERGIPYGLGLTAAFGAIALLMGAFVLVANTVFDRQDLLRIDQVAHRLLFETFGASADLGLAVTWFGNNDTVVAFVVIAAVVLGIRRQFWAAFRVVFASGLGGIVVLSLKSLFARARPIEQVIAATGYSFPSGHTFASTVFYGMMIVLAWRLSDRAWARAIVTTVALLLIVGVGLSRVYLNVHYIT
ncbi:phosphatase PAP2 family protein, partial [Rubrivirga sp.]|uniref:phosphatase PAP2 family protein n=1 Tax=Rubrivirga sp. TaxID=1885344 RepID=UPI003C737224